MSEQQLEADFPAGWNFYDREGVIADGPQVSGKFVRMEEGPLSDGGVAPIVVLDVDGTERSIWVLGTVLFNQFKKALNPDLRINFDAGEQITVLYKGKKKGKQYTYNDFAVKAENTPTSSGRSLFGGTAETATEVEAVPAYESAEAMAAQTEEVPY